MSINISYFNRTVNDWNDIPDKVLLKSTILSFKLELFEYFKSLNREKCQICFHT